MVAALLSLTSIIGTMFCCSKALRPRPSTWARCRTAPMIWTFTMLAVWNSPAGSRVHVMPVWASYTATPTRSLREPTYRVNACPSGAVSGAKPPHSLLILPHSAAHLPPQEMPARRLPLRCTASHQEVVGTGRRAADPPVFISTTPPFSHPQHSHFGEVRVGPSWPSMTREARCCDARARSLPPGEHRCRRGCRVQPDGRAPPRSPCHTLGQAIPTGTLRTVPVPAPPGRHRQAPPAAGRVREGGRESPRGEVGGIDRG